MENEFLRDLLKQVASGRMNLDAAMHALRKLPFEDLGYARIDNHRCLRQSVPEVIYCAGTSDIPVAEEAAITAEVLGNKVERLYDVGVAGIHRLLHHCDDLFRANVAIVVAGMEGALASVVGGLVSCPVIGVPTSVGYGASFGGIAALLSMLNSCASGVSVVNIDNGFGAGYQGNLINKIAVKAAAEKSAPEMEEVGTAMHLKRASCCS